MECILVEDRTAPFEVGTIPSDQIKNRSKRKREEIKGNDKGKKGEKRRKKQI